MNSDQSKSNPNQDAGKAAPTSGKIVGNKDLQGKGLQKPVIEQSPKDSGSSKDPKKT